MNYNFGKLENSSITYAPSPIIDGNKRISTTDPAVYLSYGYKQIVSTDCPQDGKVYGMTFNEDDTTITIGWTADLEETKNQKLAEITEYDEGPEVNSFTIQGVQMWLDGLQRDKLRNGLTVCEKSGMTTYDLCIDGYGVYTLPISSIYTMLDQIELYAVQCYKETFIHKQNVMALTDIDTILNYDITTGYPDKLVF